MTRLLLLESFLIFFGLWGTEPWAQKANKESIQYLYPASSDMEKAEPFSRHWIENETEAFLILPGGVKMVFIKIPAGSFLMGSPPEEECRDADEGPQHMVTFDNPFWIGKYEVTFDQVYAAKFSEVFKPRYPRPRSSFSWNEVQEILVNINLLVPGIRLPSEAEWEYACRAGTTTPFNTGETITTNQANYDGRFSYGNGNNGIYRMNLMPVGSFAPNAWGLFDMHGNVQEWCSDVYHDSYEGAPIDGSARVSPTGDYRVVRGGGWRSMAQYCRSANRLKSLPRDNFCTRGFRLAKSIFSTIRNQNTR